MLCLYIVFVFSFDKLTILSLYNVFCLFIFSGIMESPLLSLGWNIFSILSLFTFPCL